MNSMPFRLGSTVHTKVLGGPYHRRPLATYGVKMAVEIDAPCAVSVPTEDFSVPDERDLLRGITKTLMHMMSGATQPVYVGCMGGIGRTGLFLATLVKVKSEYNRMVKRGGAIDPVLYVRYHYDRRAVETSEQKQFLDNLDVQSIARWFRDTQRLINGNGEEEHYLTKAVRTALDIQVPVPQLAYVTVRTHELNWIQRTLLRWLGLRRGGLK